MNKRIINVSEDTISQLKPISLKYGIKQIIICDHLKNETDFANVLYEQNIILIKSKIDVDEFYNFTKVSRNDVKENEIINFLVFHEIAHKELGHEKKGNIQLIFQIITKLKEESLVEIRKVIYEKDAEKIYYHLKKFPDFKQIEDEADKWAINKLKAKKGNS